MQLNPSAIGGQFVLPNQPRMTTIAGTPDPFSFKDTLVDIAGFYYRSKADQEAIQRQSELQRLRLEQEGTKNLLQTKGVEFLGEAFVLVAAAILIESFKGRS